MAYWADKANGPNKPNGPNKSGKPNKPNRPNMCNKPKSVIRNSANSVSNDRFGINRKQDWPNKPNRPNKLIMLDGAERANMPTDW